MFSKKIVITHTVDEDSEEEETIEDVQVCWQNLPSMSVT
jgi:hypothetical protein